MAKQRTTLIESRDADLGKVYRCEPSGEGGLKPFAEFCVNDENFALYSIMGDSLFLYEGEIDALIDVLSRVKQEYKKAKRRKTPKLL